MCVSVPWSVLLKSLFIIRNITLTHVQRVPGPVFGGGEILWGFFGGGGVLGVIGVSPWGGVPPALLVPAGKGDSDTDVCLCCHPRVVMQRPKSLGCGVLLGASLGTP